MSDKGELTYLKTVVKQMIEECEDVDLLYLIEGILSEDAN